MRLFFCLCFFFMIIFTTYAYDPLDPNGNITLKWDIMSWTADGYVATVTMNNFQIYRHIQNPGWTLGWAWAKKEVIWSMVGAQTTEQGVCSKFKGNVPHCCKKVPTVVDLLPGVPYNQQFSNCCKGGVVGALGSRSIISCIIVSEKFKTERPKYQTEHFLVQFGEILTEPNYPDYWNRRTHASAVTWNVTCTYSQFLARKHPSCCVSFSSFYNDTITPCPSCACGCENKKSCVKAHSKILTKKGLNTPRKDNAPLLQCTHHMCPVRVHWHVKVNCKDYWRVKIAITNFNYRMNHTLWTLAVQHPNLNNVTQVFSFDYKSVAPYGSINDTGMFYGTKFYNDLLMEARPSGNVQSEV
ncbi:hypothetical protein F2Q69_00044781 [Brassica cretica]|uniref:COBRA C-terminal domain-containing protein n=1 Tax=Brassica cretica TaxID=69181 RepID=A0A8S9NRQ7_BRACR|nr:hypothetical protein F2Q69_00044781 [Brassica cretica]